MNDRYRLALATTFALLLVAGCATPQRARMDPTLPINTAGGYTQNGRELDPESMGKQLLREPAAAPHVNRARPLALTAYLLAAAGGALAGWPLGEAAGGGSPNWNLAYAGAGALGVAIPLAIWATLSVRKAVDAHNALLAAEPRAAEQRAALQVLRRGSLIYSEVELSGVKLTWLGMLGSPQPKLALRLQRVTALPDQAQCQSLAMRVDGRDLTPVSSYKAEPQGAQVRETVQAELDLDVLKSIARSRETNLTFCGRSRRLTAQATAHGSRFLQMYEAENIQVAAEPAPLAPASAAPEQSVQSELTAPEATPVPPAL